MFELLNKVFYFKYTEERMQWEQKETWSTCCPSTNQVLLDSEVDLEAPAYESPGFTALVYPRPNPTNLGHLTTTVPIHGRYHRPSDPGTREKVAIKHPKLLLKSDTCEHGKP